jgi:hypothetical protein
MALNQSIQIIKTLKSNTIMLMNSNVVCLMLHGIVKQLLVDYIKGNSRK